MSVIAIVSVKGGTGKTTSAANLGAALAKMGKRVLLIDSDSQGSLTKSLGVVPGEQQYTTASLMATALDNPDILDTIIEKAVLSASENLSLIPCNQKLAVMVTRLVVMQTNRSLFDSDDGELRPEEVLRFVVDRLRERYNYIILDSGPHRDLQMINVLTAADEVIVPVQAHYLDAEGLPDTLDIIHKVQKTTNPDLVKRGILLTMYQRNTNLAKAISAQINEMYSEKTPIFPQQIDYSVRVAEHPAYGESIIDYAPDNPAAQAYTAVAKEIMGNGKKRSV